MIATRFDHTRKLARFRADARLGIVVAGDHDGGVVAWGMETGEQRFYVRPHDGLVTDVDVRIGTSGPEVWSVGVDGVVCVRTIIDGSEVASYAMDLGPLWCIACAKDGLTYVGTEDGWLIGKRFHDGWVARIHGYGSSPVLTLSNHEGSASRFAAIGYGQADGHAEILVLGDRPPERPEWAVPAAWPLHPRLQGKASDAIVAVDQSPSGRLLLTATAAGEIGVWNRETGTLVTRESAHRLPVVAAAFVDDDTAIQIDARGSIRRIHLLTQRTHTLRLGGEVSGPTRVQCLSSDSTVICAWSERTLVTIDMDRVEWRAEADTPASASSPGLDWIPPTPPPFEGTFDDVGPITRTRRRQIEEERAMEAARRASRTCVLLIHGIRTRAEWAQQVSRVLEQALGCEVALIGYGALDTWSFLRPTSPGCQRAIERVQVEIRGRVSEGKTVSVIAHSFGTHAITEVLLRNPDLRIARLVLVGGIVRLDYPWTRVASQIDSTQDKGPQILNECGTGDIWPVVASSVNDAYGESGRFGTQSAVVTDVFWNRGHSDFLDVEHASNVWVPFLKSGLRPEGDGPRKSSLQSLIPTVGRFLRSRIVIAFVSLALGFVMHFCIA